MKLAYLFNCYPQSSQTALRREVVAFEKLGTPIERFTLRRFDGDLVDADDRAERERTRVVLAVGRLGTFVCLVSGSVTPAGSVLSGAGYGGEGRHAERTGPVPEHDLPGGSVRAPGLARRE